MATGYIYNGFGKYEQSDTGELGITLKYGGVEFWLPYQKVRAIPNWNFKEVDHNRSTPEKGELGVLTYMNVLVPGNWIITELLTRQIPVTNAEKGIISIVGKPTGKMLEVDAGWTADGEHITLEVPEREATKTEMAEAENRAHHYKEGVVADYFQSKRERMLNGIGRAHPDPVTRGYMDELGVEDIDDITAHSKYSGLNPELLRSILEEVVKATSDVNAQAIVDAVKAVRSRQHAQLSPEMTGKRSAGLAENKARWNAEHPGEAEAWSGAGKLPEVEVEKE